MVAHFACGGTNEVVKRTSVKFNVHPAMVWFGLTVVFLGAMYVLLSPPDRRRRIANGLEPVVERIGAAMEHGDQARRELHTTRPIQETEPSRLEVLVASLLARRPDLTINEIAEELDLTTAGRRALSTMLRGHPPFELSSQYGWSVGRCRGQLATIPPAFNGSA